MGTTHKNHQSGTDQMSPAEIYSWRILLEKEDESVWSTDEYICTQKHQELKASEIHLFFIFYEPTISYHIFCLTVVRIS